MCGRVVQKTNLGLLVVNLGMDAELPSHQPRYNIPPGSKILTIRANPNARVEYLKWGLIPSWSKDPKIAFNLSNARVETIFEKPSFKSAIANRRCLIPVDGYFEWRLEDGKKQPYYIQQTDSEIFLLAGIWEQWKSPQNEIIETCSVITTASKGKVSEIHDRMPVIIPNNALSTWLKGSRDEIGPFLNDSPANLNYQAVSQRMNSSKVDDADCIRPVAV
jgi:putative SOS response-associated peptidase YedK